MLTAHCVQGRSVLGMLEMQCHIFLQLNVDQKPDPKDSALDQSVQDLTLVM